MKTRIARDLAIVRRPGRPIPAAMGTAGAAQAEAGRARIRTVLRAPSDWRAPATSAAQAQPFQAKLAVGRSDDPSEREADRAAAAVASGRSVGTITVAPPFGVQRECAECEEEKKKTRRRECASHAAERAAHAPAGSDRPVAGSAAPNEQMDAAPDSVDRALANPGEPLEPALRQDMEQRFGHDFSRVRVHSDAASEISARQVNAHAYTSGYDIVFGAGRFAPATLAGRRLLAHELTHVVQQTGKIDGLQTKLIQRDGSHKAGDVTQEEKEALINFKNDWKNNFSHYDTLIAISDRSYDRDQKEGLKAVKLKDGSIKIILGKPYSIDDDNERIRWQWIKAEVIDKNIKADKFEDLAYDPTHSKLIEIGPPSAVGQYCTLNCPATAAALDHYLRTGKVSPAICNRPKETIEGYGFDISTNKFATSVSWEKAEATIKQQLKKHGDFVIVEGTRSEKQMEENKLAKNHYFSVVNVKGQLFAIDAFGGGIVSDSISSYINNRVVATTYRIVEGEFKVKEIIPK